MVSPIIISFLQLLVCLFLGSLSLQRRVRHHAHVFVGATVFMAVLPAALAWLYQWHFAMWLQRGYESGLTLALTAYHVWIVVVWSLGWERAQSIRFYFQ